MRLFKQLLLIMLLVASPLGQAKPLVLGQISDRPGKDLDELRPMVDYAAAHLTSLGISSGEVRLFDSAEALIAAMQAGEVDWVTETPYTAARLVREAGARPLLRKWKRGQQYYQTLIYTHADSAIREIGDLAGKRIAFEHPESFSSYFVPRLILEQAGLQLTALETIGQAPDTDRVGYLFSRNEKNNALWVHKSLVSAGALNNSDWENPKRVPDALRQDLRIIYRSVQYPRAMELVSPGLALELADGLRKLLLGMAGSGATDILARYEHTTGFAPLQPGDLQLLHDIYENSRSW
ncbi:phosphate/phosphite/phosphonate ABC transporter substrate-binding protein [Marinobacterium aestuariivivens]|uniref:Phosphate/phosphite/phosphonate ABC transporter substrate-binding protein n=1 Tax=Marinobacterium aestuariivivens TaxID=1698799 RepID=A0ABW1ZZ79_9GAMM